eukprot:4004551-Alexandrium_andersonii.AAC.1
MDCRALVRRCLQCAAVQGCRAMWSAVVIRICRLSACTAVHFASGHARGFGSANGLSPFR